MRRLHRLTYPAAISAILTACVGGCSQPSESAIGVDALSSATLTVSIYGDSDSCESSELLTTVHSADDCGSLPADPVKSVRVNGECIDVDHWVRDERDACTK